MHLVNSLVSSVKEEELLGRRGIKAKKTPNWNSSNYKQHQNLQKVEKTPEDHKNKIKKNSFTTQPKIFHLHPVGSTGCLKYG